jgi:hypothetical protein
LLSCSSPSFQSWNRPFQPSIGCKIGFMKLISSKKTRFFFHAFHTRVSNVTLKNVCETKDKIMIDWKFWLECGLTTAGG